MGPRTASGWMVVVLLELELVGEDIVFCLDPQLCRVRRGCG
jgi:hypothetical protein